MAPAATPTATATPRRTSSSFCRGRIPVAPTGEYRVVSVFLHELAKAQPKGKQRRRWLYVPYDQLTDKIGPLARESASGLGIVLVETTWKARQRPYHKQKLALVLANQRHFALEQARRGIKVRYLIGTEPYAELIGQVAAELGPLQVMRPAERELRAELADLFADGSLQEIPHEGWLSTQADFAAQAGPPWRMDAFYRAVRQRTGILMERGKPVGGKFSFDADNRKPWQGTPAAPDELTFPRDAIKDEVLAMVAREFAQHPGELRPDHLPASQRDAELLWEHGKRACLPQFGPYEDAMSTQSTGLFHTRISPLLNLHRLLPADVVRDAVALDIPLASKEGFVRQILGWREFVRHVHEATDGFRTLPAAMAAKEPSTAQPLPAAFWHGNSGLHCLDRVVQDVWREAYSHHITRLMVLGNLASLLDVSPRALTDWFWVAYADAYDWVVEPNVLAMACHAHGEVMTTKPYVSGSAYIDRMSDYCEGCAFDPKTTCPVTRLYWHFLNRNQQRLAGNHRMAIPLRAAAQRTPAQKRADASTFAAVTSVLAKGGTLSPDSLPVASVATQK